MICRGREGRVGLLLVRRLRLALLWGQLLLPYPFARRLRGLIWARLARWHVHIVIRLSAVGRILLSAVPSLLLLLRSGLLAVRRLERLGRGLLRLIVRLWRGRATCGEGRVDRVPRSRRHCGLTELGLGIKVYEVGALVTRRDSRGVVRGERYLWGDASDRHLGLVVTGPSCSLSAASTL